MRHRVYWIVLGGISFWLPAMSASVASHENVNTVFLNLAPLAGVILLGGVTWLYSNHFPKWGWVLAGIYILGPVSMSLPSVLLRGQSAPSPQGEKLIMGLLWLFPPMTLWMALLNGMIFSVVTVTVILTILARRRAAEEASVSTGLGR